MDIDIVSSAHFLFLSQLSLTFLTSCLSLKIFYFLTDGCDDVFEDHFHQYLSQLSLTFLVSCLSLKIFYFLIDGGDDGHLLCHGQDEQGEG